MVCLSELFVVLRYGTAMSCVVIIMVIALFFITLLLFCRAWCAHHSCLCYCPVEMSCVVITVITCALKLFFALIPHCRLSMT